VNRAADVKVVQDLLNGVPMQQGGPNTPLKIDGLCGPKTTGAIQAFQSRQFGPTRADSRVDPGGPTLASLNELSATGGGLFGPDVCLLLDPCPVDVKTASLFQLGTGPSFVLASFVPTSAPAGGGDAAIMQAAFKDSRTTLKLARNALTNLLTGFGSERAGRSLNDFQKRVLNSVGKWLKVETAQNTAARTRTTAVVQSAINLMDRNLAVKTSAGADPTFRRVPDAFHAAVDGNPDHGVNCGDHFFTVDGPHCRRDVLTHEFFHFLGVHHGGGALNGPTVRSAITTTTQALDSADNLAQLVSELVNGKTDACVRAGD